MFQKTLTGGRYNESNYPVQELWRKRGGGGRRIFEGRDTMVVAALVSIYVQFFQAPVTKHFIM